MIKAIVLHGAETLTVTQLMKSSLKKCERKVLGTIFFYGAAAQPGPWPPHS